MHNHTKGLTAFYRQYSGSILLKNNLFSETLFIFRQNRLDHWEAIKSGYF